MRARLIVMLAGEPMRNPGEIVEGDEAVRMCAAGFAVPMVEEIETAEMSVKRETAVSRTSRKRT